MNLTWNANTETDLAGYRVYRSSGGEYQLLTPQLQASPAYTDATPAAGTYYYAVTAVDFTGNESAASAAVFATTTQPACNVRVESIGMSIKQSNLNWQATASVLVLDQIAAPHAGATVYGDWYYKGNVVQTGASAQTDAAGVASLLSPNQRRARSGDVFLFRVTNLVLSGCSYDAAQNKVSEASISVP